MNCLPSQLKLIMPDNTSTQFSPREQFIVSYYRDPKFSKARPLLGYDLAFAVMSLFMMWKFYSGSGGEPVYAFVAYALLLGRLYYLVTEGARYAEDFRSIVNKYEARISEIHKALEEKHSEGK